MINKNVSFQTVSFQTVEYIRLQKQEYEAQLALRQLDSEREMNAILTGEVEGLRGRLGAEAADERARIAALLHEHLNDWCKEETESGDIKHQYHQGSDALERLLWAIEAEEHLK